MTEQELEKFDTHLVEMLGPKCSFFGRVNSNGQISTEHEYIGYLLSEDFLPTLKEMLPEQRKTLARTMIYFEMHMRPLRKLLDKETEKEELYRFYSKIAWSHFATLVMFGMLEVVVKGEGEIKRGEKLVRIKKFLERNLPPEKMDDIPKRYKVDKLFNPRPITDFGSVIDHMWFDVRSGFVHNASIQHRGTEWSTLEGLGTREDPLRVQYDVPMQEFLQLSWEAILHSFGYKGALKESPIN